MNKNHAQSNHTEDTPATDLRKTIAAVPVTRRRLLMGVAGLLLTGALGAAAGCGGGGDDDDDFDDDDMEGTYRYRSSGSGSGSSAVSVTIDSAGRATFWTLVTGGSPFVDFGQVTVDNDGFFSQTIDGIRTSGEWDGNVVRGRTEDLQTGFRFDWDAVRQPRRVSDLPPAFMTGTYEGTSTHGGSDFYAILGVSSDGNATIFGAFDNPSSGGVDYYYFEGASFNDEGNVEEDSDYFLFLEGDRLSLRDPDTGDDLNLLIDFGSGASDVGVDPGEIVEVRVQPNRLGRAAATGTTTGVTNPKLTEMHRVLRAPGSEKALQRAVEALNGSRATRR